MMDPLSSENRRLIFLMDKSELPMPLAPPMFCPVCGNEMRLVGIESGKPGFDLHTFECEKCGRFGVRSVGAH